MPRYKKLRFVSQTPEIEKFSPHNDQVNGEVILPLEGFEAIKLSDFKGLDQSEASEIMGVSRQTYGRILKQARACVAEALVVGKRINIQGGDYQMRGPSMGRRRRRHGR